MVEISSYFSCIYSGGGVVAKSCLTLAIPWTVATRLLCPWDFPGKNTGVDCYFLLQGVFPTQGSNPCLFHCRRIIYHWATREALMHLYTIQNYMQHRCIVHIYKLFDKFYVTFIISFDILSNPGFLSLGTVDIWGWIILCCGKLMCIIEYLAASWIPPHWKPVVHPIIATTKNASRHCQTSSGRKSLQSRTTGLTNNWDHKVLL